MLTSESVKRFAFYTTQAQLLRVHAQSNSAETSAETIVWAGNNRCRSVKQSVDTTGLRAAVTNRKDACVVGRTCSAYGLVNQ